MTSSGVLSALVAAAVFLHAQAAADDESWPRSYTVDGAQVVLYEPQIERWQGSSIGARFAAGIKPEGADEAVYGSFAAHADALANTETRTVTLFNFTVDDVKFPDATDRVSEFTRLITALAPDKPVKVPLDRLLAAVPSDDMIAGTAVTTPGQTKPPNIIVRFEDTVLVSFDGKPIFRGIEGTGLEAAVNTPATMLRPANGGPLYLLTNEGRWLKASGWAGPWLAAGSPPAGLDRVAPEHPVAQALKNAWSSRDEDAGVPEVVTSEIPTELVLIDGSPAYSRIGQLPLVRVDNTDTPLFYHLDLSLFYVLISGRWFSAADLTGPWVYVSHNELPAEFAQIPTDDPSADVRASIAGTREAEEAAKEAQIPSFARVNLSEAPEIRVEYDGEPLFEDVPGTGLAYAVNTVSAVVCAGGRYYCCRDGVWFVADRAFGSPWRCATVVPSEIYSLPPSCPLYHTRFCEVASFSDGWVIYRCTPGYWGTYLDPLSHVCVYGTGWRYPAYVSPDYYFGHSWTYGLGCRYLPRFGFVRVCDRVVHTGWFRHTGRGSALCRADSERWGGRFEREHWRGSGGRTVAFSSWSGRIVTHPEEVAKTLRHHGPEKRGAPSQAGRKPQIVSHDQAGAALPARFDRDVRAGQHGEVYRRGADGWLRREAGQWKLPDKNHPVDPRLIRSGKPRETERMKPPAVSSNIRGTGRDHRNTAIPAQVIASGQDRPPGEASHREAVTRPGRPPHIVEKKSAPTPKQDPRAARDERPIDVPPAHHTPSAETNERPPIRVEQLLPSRTHRVPVPDLSKVEHRKQPRIAPKVEHRETPRVTPKVEHRDPPRVAPKAEHRDPPRVAPKVEHSEAPRVTPKVEHRDPPRPVRPIERHDPRPQTHREVPRHPGPPRPQLHHEVPRRIEPPRPSPRPWHDPGTGGGGLRSQRSDDNKAEKKQGLRMK